MNKIAAIAVLMGSVFTLPVTAQNLESFSGAQAIAIIGNGGGNGAGTQRVVSVPTVAPPSFYGANPCSNSASGGGGFMGGGISFGGQWTEKECRDQEWFRMLNMARNGADADVATAYICGEYPRIREAYRVAGRPCPQDRVAPEPTATQTDRVPQPVAPSTMPPMAVSANQVPDWCMGDPRHATRDTIERCPNLQQQVAANRVAAQTPQRRTR